MPPSEEKKSVQVSGDTMHGTHHAEVLIMHRDADGPGGAGNYYNSLGVVDDVPDEEFDARLYGTFVVPDFDAFIAGKQTPYRETVSKRTTTWFFDAGTEVYELVSPEGTVFVMQSASLAIDAHNTVDTLPTLGDRLSLPEGWQFRARRLEEELVMPVTYDDDPPNTIVLDELENNYQRVRTP